MNGSAANNKVFICVGPAHCVLGLTAVAGVPTVSADGSSIIGSVRSSLGSWGSRTEDLFTVVAGAGASFPSESEKRIHQPVVSTSSLYEKG